ncbi:MAG: tRNA 2-thiouridine(34) synthase MnmA, partial [Pseudomonadales bacterium]|nr:tRNA 2-thiouridine(34) synthase MnmA [Pseudomonadales bacterium]
GADWVATGHYARLDHSGDQPRLMKAVDASKDQSYFLQAVSASQLRHCVFPLGGMEKQDVRALARESMIPTHAKKDSTGICFIGERRFADFLNQYIPAQPGAIVTIDGQELGRHRGLMFHTIGQRQGLGIGGVENAPDAPWYVVDKDLAGNRLIVAQGNDHPALFSSGLTTRAIHWVDEKGPLLPAQLQVKIRYRQPDQPARLEADPAMGFRLRFDEPQRAVSPGQWVCFYDGDTCLGGGIIESRTNN